MEDPSLVILACGVVVTLLLRGANRRCRIRIICISDWIRNYQYYGAYHHLVYKELEVGDTDTYRNFLSLQDVQPPLLAWIASQLSVLSLTSAYGQLYF